MSNQKLYALLSSSYALTIGCFFSHNSGGLVFFGGCAAVWTYCLFWPTSRLATFYKIRSSSAVTPSFEQVFQDLGDFTYTATGFELPTTTGRRLVNWTDIQAMFGYKRDLYTTDLVCLDIFCVDGQGIRLHEELPGWFQFIRKLPEHFPSVKPGWEIALTFPAFETNLTLIYEKDGLSLPQAAALHYRSDATAAN